MLRVKFDGISRRTPELEHLPWTAFIRCIWNILFPIKAPFTKKGSFSDLCMFCLLSSTKSAPMYLVTCWKYKQSHIFISPCRNDPSQLQNCRTKKFFTVFETLLVTWRQRKEIVSPHTPKQRIFCVFLASSNVSFGSIREALHRFNGCAKIWSAPGTDTRCAYVWRRFVCHNTHSHDRLRIHGLCTHAARAGWSFPVFTLPPERCHYFN